MKHVKTYESSKINLLSEYKRLQKVEKKVLKLVDEYVRLNKKGIGEFFSILDDDWYDESYHIELEDDSIKIYYSFHDEMEYDAITLTGEDYYNDFLKYMEDPDLYKNTRQYNL